MYFNYVFIHTSIYQCLEKNIYILALNLLQVKILILEYKDLIFQTKVLEMKDEIKLKISRKEEIIN